MKKISVLLITLIFVLILTSCTGIKGVFFKYDVTFDLNGGVAGDGFAETVTVKHGETVSISIPTMENFTFVGWFDGSVQYTENTPIEKDVTLVAKWEFNNTYTLTFETNGMADVPVAYPIIGELPKIPQTPIVEGYVFAGWYFDAEYTTRYFFDYPLTEATTLYAKFYDLSLGEYIVISNVEQLMAIKDDPTAKYLLACDINCKGETLTPIDEFTGEIDGNGYRIFNFDISEDTNNVAFIRTNKGTIKNLRFDDFTFDVLIDTSGAKYYGIVCATNEGTVENCHTSSNSPLKIHFRLYTASSNVYLGGIVGYNAGTVVNCTNDMVINPTFIASGWDGYHCDGYVNSYIAGICGYVTADGKVIDCANLSDVEPIIESENIYGHNVAFISGVVSTNLGTVENSKNVANININFVNNGYIDYRIGGAVASNSGNVMNSYNQGNIDFKNSNRAAIGYIGGFIGYNSGKVYNCYTVSDIKCVSESINAVGGFVGYNELLSGHESLINKCFAFGSIELTNDPIDVGYFVGLSTGTVKDSYYCDASTMTLVTTTVTEGENPETIETREPIEATNNIGVAKAESVILSLDFLENTLYFDRMVWFLADGKLPELR